MAGVAAGVGGMARAGGGAIVQAARAATQRAGNAFTGGGSAPATGGPEASAPPAWARRLQADQRARHHRQATAQAIREGDRPGAPANPELDQKE
jgi:type IV secretion system protein TrbL